MSLSISRGCTTDGSSTTSSTGLSATSWSEGAGRVRPLASGRVVVSGCWYDDGGRRPPRGFPNELVLDVVAGLDGLAPAPGGGSITGSPLGPNACVSGRASRPPPGVGRPDDGAAGRIIRVASGAGVAEASARAGAGAGGRSPVGCWIDVGVALDGGIGRRDARGMPLDGRGSGRFVGSSMAISYAERVWAWLWVGGRAREKASLFRRKRCPLCL
jgi:hypothetical protein